MTRKTLPQRLFMAIAMLFVLSTASLYGQNLVPHGNFDDNIQDFNTDYEYKWGLGGDDDVEKYCISPNANNNSTAMFNCTDHTSGAGLYMVVNGSTNPNKKVWDLVLYMSLRLT